MLIFGDASRSISLPTKTVLSVDSPIPIGRQIRVSRWLSTTQVILQSWTLVSPNCNLNLVSGATPWPQGVDATGVVRDPWRGRHGPLAPAGEPRRLSDLRCACRHRCDPYVDGGSLPARHRRWRRVCPLGERPEIRRVRLRRGD